MDTSSASSSRRALILTKHLQPPPAPEVELDSAESPRLYAQACTFLVTHDDLQRLHEQEDTWSATDLRFKAQSNERSTRARLHDEMPSSSEAAERVSMTLGLGVFRLEWKGIELRAVQRHTSRDPPPRDLQSIPHNQRTNATTTPGFPGSCGGAQHGNGC